MAHRLPSKVSEPGTRLRREAFVRSSDLGRGTGVPGLGVAASQPPECDQCFGATFVPLTAAGQFRILTGFPRR